MSEHYTVEVGPDKATAATLDGALLAIKQLVEDQWHDRLQTGRLYGPLSKQAAFMIVLGGPYPGRP